MLRAVLARAVLAAGLVLSGACGPAAAGVPAGRVAPPARAADAAGPVGEPVPIASEEFAARRAALIREMGDGVLVVFGSAEAVQSSNFRYLTGIVEPGAALIVTKSRDQVDQTLYVLPRNPEREIWDGARLGADGARERTGIDARPADRFLPALDSAVARHRTVYSLTPLPTDPGSESTLSREQQLLQHVLERYADRRVVALTDQLRRLRGTKSAAELDMIRRAVHITGIAHREAMRHARGGMNEFEVQALVEFIFRRHGAERPGYPSIVGSGPNATTLHYRDADRFMRAGELLLMDVGASYRGYTADITRTIPLDGRFSPEQRAVYEVVLAAQKAAEIAVRPNSRWSDANDAANEVIRAGLTRLGLIDGPEATYDCEANERVTRCPQHRIFYMHGLGHGIGLDVHDPDAFLNFGVFAVGSAFTIEPGIYVRADAFDYLPDTQRNREMVERLRPALERYRDIGVRIEDVYMLTPNGVERVSSTIPREVAEIEAVMREASLADDTRRAEIVEWYRAFEPLPRR